MRPIDISKSQDLDDPIEAMSTSWFEIRAKSLIALIVVSRRTNYKIKEG